MLRKTINIWALVILMTVSNAYSQMGIGTKQPDSSAVLEMYSTSQGFLPPRMNIQQRDAINKGSKAEGLVIYNTDDKCLQYWNGSEWKCNASNGQSGGTDVITKKIVDGTKPHVFAFDDIKGFFKHPSSYNKSLFRQFIKTIWLNNEEFIAVSMTRECTGSDHTTCKKYAFRLTIYNINLGVINEFDYPTYDDYIWLHNGASPIAIKLSNGNIMLMIHSSKCSIGSSNRTRCRKITVINPQNGKIVSDPAPLDTYGYNPKYYVNGASIYFLEEMHNGNILAGYSASEHGTNLLTYATFIFDKDGNFIKKRIEQSNTNQGVHLLWGVTDFGYFTMKSGINFSKSGTYSTFDASGNLIKSFSIPSNDANLVFLHYRRSALFKKAFGEKNTFVQLYNDKLLKVKAEKESLVVEGKDILGLSYLFQKDYSSQLANMDEISNGEFLHISDLSGSNAGRKTAIGVFADGSPFAFNPTFYNIAKYTYTANTSEKVESFSFSPGSRLIDHHNSYNDNKDIDQQNFSSYQSLSTSSYVNSLKISPDKKKAVVSIDFPNKTMLSVIDVSNLDEIKVFPFAAKNNDIKQHVGKRFALMSPEANIKEVKVKIANGYQNGDAVESYCSSPAVACATIANYLIISGAKSSGASPVQDFILALNEMTFRTSATAGKRVLEIQVTAESGMKSDVLQFSINVAD